MGRLRIAAVTVVNSIGERVIIREAVINCPERRPLHPDRAITVEVDGEPKGVFVLAAPDFDVDEKEFGRAVDPAIGLEWDAMRALVAMIGVEPGGLYDSLDGVLRADVSFYPDPNGE